MCILPSRGVQITVDGLQHKKSSYNILSIRIVTKAFV